MESLSYMNDMGEYESTCGYCNQEDTGVSHGALSQDMTVYTYQDLIDHGWRRSGTWLYKPNLERTCCKQYTIRLDVHKYKAKRSQKKTLRKWTSFLEGRRGIGAEDDETESLMEVETAPPLDRPAQPQSTPLATNADGTDQAMLTAAITSLLNECCVEGLFPKASYPPVAVQVPSAKQLKKLPTGVCFTSAAAFSIAAAASKASAQKWAAATLAELLTDKFNAWSRQHGGAYCAQAVNGHINISHPEAPSCSRNDVDGSTSSQNVNPPANSTSNPKPNSPLLASLPCKMDAHQPSSSSKHTHTPPIPRHDPGPASTSKGAHPHFERHEFKMVMVPATFIQEEFELYRLYQMVVHNDDPHDITPSKYKKFLVESPLQHVTRSEDPSAPESGYGSFHQQYWLDGKLIAVGVVDVLPRCLSSVYFIWHPDYASLSLGRLSAVKEIEWVQQTCRTGSPQLHYYYMGYYIHSCPKMRYKGEYELSELLCPEARVWVNMTDQVRSALDQSPYVAFSHLPGAVIEPNLAGPWLPLPNNQSISATERQQLEQMQISTPFWNGVCMSWKDLKAAIRPNMWASIEKRLSKFRRAAGPAVPSIAYQLS